MEEFSVPYFLAVFKRHLKSFITTCVVLFIVASIFAIHWANYRSTATVEIQRPAVPQNMVIPNSVNMEDAIVALADDHVSQIQQDVTSLHSLSEIITKYDLYKSERESMPMERVADLFRNKIKLTFVNNELSNPIMAQKETAEQLSAIGFTLSFDYKDPVIAKKVDEELVQRFLDEDSKQRQNKAIETSSFLDSQIKALETSMAEQEKKIADFKSKYGETGTTALLFNQQASVTTSLDLHNVESQITANEGTQGSLRAQLATVDPYSRVLADGQVLTTPAIQLKALEAQYAMLSGRYGPEYPDLIKLRNQIKELKSQTGVKTNNSDNAQLKAQIVDVRTNLAAAQSNGGPEDPDVIALQYKLKGLEKKLAASGKDEPDLGNGIKKDADNPAYLALVSQLNSAEEQHKSLVSQRDALQAQQSKYQHAIAENPGVEQQMAVLTRDYENTQTRYREIKEKKMIADINEQLEQGKKGAHLSIINPPSLPTTTHPARPLLLLCAFIFSLMGGIMLVMLMEAMNENVYGRQQLAAILGAAPMVIVPYITTRAERARKMRLKTYGALASIFICVFALAMTFIAVPTYYTWSLISHWFKLS